jgi:hypothetical protein
MFEFFPLLKLLTKKMNQNNLNIGNWFQRVMLKFPKGKITIYFCCNDEQHIFELICGVFSE